MSRYDEAKGNLQALYDAALEERIELQKKLDEVQREIELLGAVCDKKMTYSVANLKDAEPKTSNRGRKSTKAAKKEKEDVAGCPKRERIKGDRIRELVVKCLSDAAPNSVAALEIYDKLISEGLPKSKSFQTRVYSLLTAWVKDGTLIRPGRGVYQLASDK